MKSDFIKRCDEIMVNFSAATDEAVKAIEEFIAVWEESLKERADD